jgi:hypothetical protein
VTGRPKASRAVVLVSTCFNPSRPIVVFNGGAQIAVGKEVAGHSDLIGRKNSPEGSRRIPCIVRGNAKAKAARRVLAEDVADCGVGESAALRVQPKRGAGRVRPPDRS